MDMENKNETSGVQGNEQKNPSTNDQSQKVEPMDMKKAYKEKLAQQDGQIEKLKFDVEHWKNEYYKAYADMANLRKSMENDQKDVYKYRIEGFAQNLLNVLASFDMAFKAETKSEEVKNYLIGFQYVYKQLVTVLTDEGIVELDPKVGDKFDVNTMHAIETVDDPGEENIVKEVRLKGYKLHEHLIRPAMVTVSKHPQPKEEVNKENATKVEDKKEDIKK